MTCSRGECWWSQSRADGCRSAGAPTAADRPSVTHDEGDPPLDVYLGFSHLWTGETAPNGDSSDTAWQHFGLDLDGRCTNSDSCTRGQNMQPCKAATEHVPFDGLLCRDNTLASLMPLAAAAPEVGKRFGLSEEEFNCNLWRGTYNMVFKLSGYNGRDDDSDVRLDVYISPGTERAKNWNCPHEDFAASYPLWRASQVWNIDPENLTRPITNPGVLPDSKVADPHAYVRRGYLVAHIPGDSLLRLAGDGSSFRGFALKAHEAVWTGKLSRARDERWFLTDGLIAGRVRTTDLVQSFRQLGLCTGVGLDGFYRDVIEYIEQSADLRADAALDPARDCDAMSFGIGFEAAQLTPGAAQAAVPLVECCAPGVAIEDCNPKCGDGRRTGKEKCDSAIPAGQPGACPTACSAGDACTPNKLEGSGCDTECVARPITAIGARDGCCPERADSTTDPDCTAKCGNGVVEPGETCDPCAACTSDDPCAVITSQGAASSCTLVCNRKPLMQCRDGDRCCALACTANDDSDCSTTCGNGRIEANETCDPGSSVPCPADCDDGNPCTNDYSTGSGSNCSVRCTHVPITQAASGDHCCPRGASANSDSDCLAVCGNGTVEGTEQCDDGNTQANDGCSPECKKESELEQCLAQLASTNMDCARCECEKCRPSVLGCYAPSKPEQRELCVNLVRCGRDNACDSTACYCGSVSLGACVLSRSANGKCRPQVEAAAESSVPGDILTRSSDSNYPVGRANQLAECTLTNCKAECELK